MSVYFLLLLKIFCATLKLCPHRFFFLAPPLHAGMLKRDTEREATLIVRQTSGATTEA
jgi:hypothetical protein